LESEKSAASDFYFIRALASGRQMFGVRGNGQVEFELFTANKAQLTGGVTVSGGGIVVPEYGVTIADGGLNVGNGGASIFS